MKREILLLSFAFALTTFSFVGVHRFTTIIYQSLGSTRLGFWSLLAIYGAYAPMNLLTASLIQRFGTKSLLVLSTPVYALYIWTLLVPSTISLLAVSFFLGIAASIMWNAENVFLISISRKNDVGRNTGFFSSVIGLSSFLSIISVGWILNSRLLSLDQLVKLLGIGPVLGSIVLLFLPSVRNTVNSPIERMNMAFLVRSKTLLRLAPLWFLTTYVSGYTLSILPLRMRNIFSLSTIGILGSLFWLTPFLFSWASGRFSDRVGRGRVFLAVGFAILWVMTSALVKDIASPFLTSTVNAYTSMFATSGVLFAILLGSVGMNGFSSILILLLPIAIVLTSYPLLFTNIEKVKISIRNEIKHP